MNVSADIVNNRNLSAVTIILIYTAEELKACLVPAFQCLFRGELSN